jgi:hypothetical protein
MPEVAGRSSPSELGLIRSWVRRDGGPVVLQSAGVLPFLSRPAVRQSTIARPVPGGGILVGSRGRRERTVPDIQVDGRGPAGSNWSGSIPLGASVASQVHAAHRRQPADRGTAEG